MTIEFPAVVPARSNSELPTNGGVGKILRKVATDHVWQTGKAFATRGIVQIHPAVWGVTYEDTQTLTEVFEAKGWEVHAQKDGMFIRHPEVEWDFTLATPKPRR